jgi:hypothetical protein
MFLVGEMKKVRPWALTPGAMERMANTKAAEKDCTVLLRDWLRK